MDPVLSMMIDSAIHKLGKDFSLARRRRHISQASLAKSIDVPVSFVRRMESGDPRVPIDFYARALYIFGELQILKNLLDKENDEIDLSPLGKLQHTHDDPPPRRHRNNCSRSSLMTPKSHCPKLRGRFFSIQQATPASMIIGIRLDYHQIATRHTATDYSLPGQTTCHWRVTCKASCVAAPLQFQSWCLWPACKAAETCPFGGSNLQA